MTIIKGTPSALSTIFYNNVPLIFSNKPSWNIYDFDNDKILEGTGVQNPGHPEEWVAYFTIPDTAPIDVDKKYRIQWIANVNNVEYKNDESFIVLEEGEPFTYDTSSIHLISDFVTDQLITASTPTNLKFEIITSDEQTIYTCEDQGNFSSRNLNGSIITTFNSKALIPEVKDFNVGIYPYLLRWTYTTEQANTEFHTMYVTSAKAIINIEAMKRYMDKARNYDINPNLRWTNAELAHFLLIGMERINSSAPTLTYWSINTLPQPLNYLLLKCAEHEALNALYLAEGFSAFDFTGASTSLTVDRTQYIQTKMDEINSWITENLRDTKRLVIRSSGAGVLSIAITPSTNVAVRVSNSFILSRLMRFQPLS